MRYIITADCRVSGKVIKKGEFLELDPEDPKDGQKIAELNLSGRLLIANKENIELIKSELELEADKEKRSRVLQPA
jgi:hypothetical protein